jgi:hypothetical protein
MKLDLHLDIQQPITRAGWKKPSVAALQCYETFVLRGFQCCYILPFSHCKSGLNDLTRLQGALGNMSEFGSVLHDPTETGQEHTNTVSPHHTPHFVAQYSSDRFSPRLHKNRNLL